MVGDPGDKAKNAIQESYESTDMERFHDYSWSDLVDCYWLGYLDAVKESRPDD